MSCQILTGALQIKTKRTMTLHALTHKAPLAPIYVARRQNGATNAPGRLIRVIPQIHHTPPVALVQFPDGIEPVDLEDITETPQITPAEQLTLL